MLNHAGHTLLGLSGPLEPSVPGVFSCLKLPEIGQSNVGEQFGLSVISSKSNQGTLRDCLSKSSWGPQIKMVCAVPQESCPLKNPTYHVDVVVASWKEALL